MKFVDWGLIPYQEALNKQLETLEQVTSGGEDTVVFCSHPPVVTLGRSTETGDITTWNGETVEIQRGGRATYHGPSQLVIYPILNLNNLGRDLHKYLRNLENIIINVLKSYGLEASAVRDATGVWIGDKKVASIGIGVKKWITYHGLALNVDYDPLAFQGLRPCGFQTETMISMEKLCNCKIDSKELKGRFQKEFSKLIRSSKTAEISI